MPIHRRACRLAALAGLALVLPLAGCGSSSRWNSWLLRPAIPQKPNPDSPTRAVELFQWAYRNRSLDVYGRLFTDDFVFVFASLDDAGSPYRDKPWVREDEMSYARNLFVTGTAADEAATSIDLDYSNALVALPDLRPGMDARLHKLVAVGVKLVVRRPSGNLEVSGETRLYLVRGDAAVLPPSVDLPADSLHWYIQRWEDDTILLLPARAMPAGESPMTRAAVGRPSAGPHAPEPGKSTSWGQIKARYR